MRHCYGGWIERNANEFSLDIWGFCQPKTAPTRLGEVSYHWAVGEQQGGYRNRLRKVFQPFTSSCLLQKTGATPGASWALQKTSGDFADPLVVCCGSLN